MKRKIAGILIITLSVGFLGFWELYGKEHISYYKNLVLKDDVGAYTLITSEMLSTKRVEYATQGAIRENEKNEIIGLETSQFVAGGTELHSEYFENPKLSVGEDIDSLALTLPESWVLAYPQTIKRGDVIYFYLGDEFITKAVCYHARDSSNQEVTFNGEERLYASSDVTNLEVLVTKEQAETLGQIADKGNKFILVYTKEGTNGE